MPPMMRLKVTKPTMASIRINTAMATVVSIQ